MDAVSEANVGEENVNNPGRKLHRRNISFFDLERGFTLLLLLLLLLLLVLLLLLLVLLLLLLFVGFFVFSSSFLLFSIEEKIEFQEVAEAKREEMQSLMSCRKGS